jgi:hypothetical protein
MSDEIEVERVGKALYCFEYMKLFGAIPPDGHWQAVREWLWLDRARVAITASASAERAQRMEAALRWYANGSRVVPGHTVWDDERHKWDNGDRAKEALSPATPAPQETTALQEKQHDPNLRNPGSPREDGPR